MTTSKYHTRASYNRLFILLCKQTGTCPPFLRDVKEWSDMYLFVEINRILKNYGCARLTFDEYKRKR